MKKAVVVMLLLCSSAVVSAGQAVSDLKSLTPTQEIGVIPVAVASEIQESGVVRTYRSQPTTEDLDMYLVGLANQTMDSVVKEDITKIIISGTYEQKMQYLANHSQGKTLTLIRQTATSEKGACKWIMKTFCTISCAVPGVASSCYNSCKEILVESC